MSAKTIPFKNLNADAWRNLALAAVAFFYIANFIGLILNVGIENGLGGDFLAYWSAGKIARELGFSKIYDLNILGQVQFQALEKSTISAGEFTPISVPYFSFFLLPFYFLSYINFHIGYWLWTIANFLILFFYLSFLMRHFSKNSKLSIYQKILLVSLLLSYPVYANIVNGQIEFMNLFFCGEFIRNAVNKKHVLSGIWLGGLLLKPQLLVLVFLSLLFLRNRNIILGFLISAAGIFTTSLALTNFNGLLELFGLWTGKGQQASSFAPENMANWRMIGFNINNWTSSSFGWILTILGTLATLALWVILIKKKPVMGSTLWVSSLFAIFAASLLISWHSHIHTSMILLPFLVFIAHRQANGNCQRIIDFFVFSFPIAWMMGSIISILPVIFHYQPVENLTNFLLGLSGVVVFIYIILSIIKANSQVELLKNPLHDPPMNEIYNDSFSPERKSP